MAVTNLLRQSNKKKNKSDQEKPLLDSEDGLIKLDTGKLKLPTQIIEEQGEIDRPFWQIEPVIIAIFSLSILFIIFITLLISQMPNKSQ